MKLPLATEHQIQDSIIGYLRMKGYYCQRMNSGMVENKYGGRIRLGVAGTPDLMAFKPIANAKSVEYQLPCFLLFVEVKRSPKHKATPLQLAKMKELEEYGARCIVACSIEDLQNEGL